MDVKKTKSTILSLLRSKNRCLERFLDQSNEFLNSCRPGKLPSLDVFHRDREATLKAVDLFDRKISAISYGIPPADRTPDFLASIKEELGRNESIISRILERDREIMARIEEEMSRVQRELAASRRTNDQVRKFKSSWVPESGEGLDEKL